MRDVPADDFCRCVRAVRETHPLFALKPQLGRPAAAAAAAARADAAVEPRARLGEAAFAGRPRELTAEQLARALAFLLPRARRRLADGAEDRTPQTVVGCGLR